MPELQATRGAPITGQEALPAADDAGGSSDATAEGGPVEGPQRASWPIIITVALVGYALDRLTKWWAIASLDPDHPVSILGGLVTLRLVFNPGAAFSMGARLTIVFTVIAILALVGVLCWVAPRSRGTLQAVTVGLLAAGIAGNLTDRLVREPGPLRGHVVDFISLPHFAIFNVADICISAAAVCTIWIALTNRAER